MPFVLTGQATAKDLSVRVWAEPNLANGTIQLNWEDFGHVNPITIYKKTINTNAWTTVTTLPDAAKSYTLNATEASTAQEWRVSKYFVTGTNITNYADGYIYAGINIAEKEFNGHCLMLISQRAYDSLYSEIGEAMDMVIGDGWQTDTMVLSEAFTDQEVKAKINAWNNSKSSADAEKCVFIFGHIAVPYSGLMKGTNIATVPADGHTPQHEGAWVCDGYYADTDGIFTDAGTANAGNREAIRNNPSDGKWDQILMPSLAEIQVGRVDLYDIPLLGTEISLLRRYLAKLKTYKSGAAHIPQKALVEDRLGYLGGEGPARPAWMYLPPLVGKDNITVGNFLANARANKYLFSHESSTGSYTQYVNIANTGNFNDSFNAVFNSSFGSYFGDWDNQNNILRAAVAAPGFSLTNCWNGRPLMLFHHMSLGENIGFSVRSMQNNNPSVTGENTYPAYFMQGRAHQSLIGDPTLRMQMFEPVTALSGVVVEPDNEIKLDWLASPDLAVIGHNVYRSQEHNGVYEKINTSRIVGTTFTDKNPFVGENHYMVRAVKLDSNASGTFYNQSIGALTKVTNIVNGRVKLPQAQIAIFPNPTPGKVQIQMLSKTMNKAVLTVKDLYGKEVLRQQIAQTTEIECNLSAGLYIFSIISDNFAPYTQKVVKY